MVVVGKHAVILDDTSNKVYVNPFTPYYQALDKVSIVDAAVQYTCQFTANMCILLFRNDLSLTSMYKNLIMPFIVRELGLLVKDTVKIHSMDPSMEYHSIYFTNFGIHITLFLLGVFSYISTYNPSLAALEVKYDIYIMNP